MLEMSVAVTSTSPQQFSSLVFTCSRSSLSTARVSPWHRQLQAHSESMYSWRASIRFPGGRKALWAQAMGCSSRQPRGREHNVVLLQVLK
jgi:hypothetical protein